MDYKKNFQYWWIKSSRKKIKKMKNHMHSLNKTTDPQETPDYTKITMIKQNIIFYKFLNKQSQGQIAQAYFQQYGKNKNKSIFYWQITNNT